MTESGQDVVRRTFAAFLDGDRLAAESLLAEDFVFTSPQDDHIDREEYFARCFPTREHFSAWELKRLVSTGDDVFVLYEYEVRDSGERFRNAEVLTVRDGRVVETQVFFGGRARS